MTDAAADSLDTDTDTDIVVIGGGIAGSLAAVTLGRAGHRVILVDINAEYPPDFRVEKIAGAQVPVFERLGLIHAVAAAGRPFDRVLNIRDGRRVDVSRSPHFGILYDDLVRTVRAALPETVRFIVGRVTDIETSSRRQTVKLLGGQAFSARLVVLATGMSDMLRSRLGMERRVITEKQSMSFGFFVVPGQGVALAEPSLNFYGAPGNAIDYFNLFPTRQGLRANLFTFRDYRDPWIRAMRADPRATLLAAMPWLSRYLGNGFAVEGKVQNWLMDLARMDGVRQPGVVLIGDAYQTSCPATGKGVSRVLTDVEQLCRVHIPAWLQSPGMGADKIAAFYADPVKLAMDELALQQSQYRRSLTIDTSLPWELRRRLMFLRRRTLGMLREALPRRAA